MKIFYTMKFLSLCIMDAKAPVIFFLLCSIFSLSFCCSVDTFNNSTVTLVGAKSIKSITGCFEPNEALIKVSYIQVVNESVPVLRRDAIHGLPKLLDVILEKDRITDIEPGAFYNLTKLYLLKIKYNEIKVIREGVFNNLTLKELCLTDNKIEIIHPNAFDDMPNLRILFLNENKLTVWSSDWFKRSPQVSVLNFEYNVITTIPFRSLQNINGELWLENVKVEVNVQLNDNKIRKIEDGAFEGIEKLGWLFLHRNEIEDIGEESLGSLKSVEWVRLDNNKLKCVPAKLVEISPKVVYYLYSNPLSAECKNKYSITVLR
ncbi:prolargin-like [Anoplophora glabripennis]|nr:prolargin-like [Anoplophora glabripennis]